MSNVYYDPEEFGLTAVGDIELTEPDYSFYILAVWKGHGNFYTAVDSGCSCPTPFEEYNMIESLTLHETSHSVVAEIRSYGDTYQDSADLISNVMAL